MYFQTKKDTTILTEESFVRLTPVLMVVVWFTATWYYRLGSGPWWSRIAGKEQELCHDKWWHNMFYIQNFLFSDNQMVGTFHSFHSLVGG